MFHTYSYLYEIVCAVVVTSLPVQGYLYRSPVNSDVRAPGTTRHWTLDDRMVGSLERTQYGTPTVPVRSKLQKRLVIMGHKPHPFLHISSSVVGRRSSMNAIPILEYNITMVLRSLCFLVLSTSFVATAWMTTPLTTGSLLGRGASNTRRFAEKFSFSKYEGLGNDFILIDNRDRSEPSLTPQESEKLCDRNFGIGGDGVIFALKPPSDDYDFTMRIYNSDGSEPVRTCLMFQDFCTWLCWD